jgi:hypothetical protein
MQECGAASLQLSGDGVVHGGHFLTRRIVSVYVLCNLFDDTLPSNEIMANNSESVVQPLQNHLLCGQMLQELETSAAE